MNALHSTGLLRSVDPPDRACPPLAPGVHVRASLFPGPGVRPVFDVLLQVVICDPTDQVGHDALRSYGAPALPSLGVQFPCSCLPCRAPPYCPAAGPVCRTLLSPANKHRPPPHDFLQRPVVGRSPRRPPFSGFRFGEAKHPGPQTNLLRFFGDARCHSVQSDAAKTAAQASPDRCTFAVVDPTSVLHKAQCFQQVGADVLVLSETSAVAQAQRMTASAMRSFHFKCLWGLPVPSHHREGSSGPSLRGHAAGVATMSRLPCRAARPPMAAVALDTCRLFDCFVRLGSLEVRVIAFYGFPLSQADAKDRTNELLDLAWQRASATATPCIVAGDFNSPPLDLPAGEPFAAQGYREVHQMHYQRTGEMLPPTCRNSTRDDTALIHPALLPHWDGASVLEHSNLFDSHAPLLFCFRAFKCQPCRSTWCLPRPWTDLSPSPEYFERAFLPHYAKLRRDAVKCESAEDVGTALLNFSEAAEAALSQALAEQHAVDPVRQPHKNLPRAYRGRCVDRPLLQRPLPSVVRPARAGDYTPDEEVTSVLGHLKVRQVRRVQTLLSGLRKLARLPLASADPLRYQLGQEWTAICRAKGYAPSFPAWVLQVAHFTYFPAGLPAADWLDDLFQYLRFDADDLARQQAKLRRQKFQLHLRLDGANGSSKQGRFRGHPGTAPPALHRSASRACLSDTENSRSGFFCRF